MQESEKCRNFASMNPFITYGYESPAYFCDRKAETEELITLFTNGNHVALVSPRRMGKTGLIQHCFAQPQLSDNYYTFLIDIYATKTLQDMVYQMGHSIVKRLKPFGQRAIDRFLQVVTSLRTGISFDGQGNASWNLAIGDISSPTFTLEEIFNYLQSADKRCIVAIDEFQAITDYPEKNVEALLRTYVQQCRNAVFVFAGSQRSLMSEMFSSPARPFYQSVSMMFLQPVALSEYEKFAMKLFSERGKSLAEDVVKTVYEKYDGTTWYLQKIFNQLYSMFPEGSEITVADVETAENKIIAQNEEAYKDTLFRLPVKQRDLLFAIGRDGKTKQLTSANFVKRHALTSQSSVQKAAAALLSKQLITSQLGVYELYDKFFTRWIQKET